MPNAEFSTMNEESGGLLLDTHAIIWLVQGNLKEAVAERVNQSALRDEVFISPVSAWEVGLLARPLPNGECRLTFVPDPYVWFSRVLEGGRIRLAMFDPQIAISASFLPEGLHKDPADRLLVATARTLDLTLVTRDRHILNYSQAGHVRTLVC